MRQIGTISLGKKVTASDPCYESGIWCAKELEVKPGIYNCYAEEEGSRIASLCIIHQDHVDNIPSEKHIGSAGVDSGQFGFFDAEYYKANQPDDNFNDPDSWYRRICDITILNDKGVIDGKGVVSSSGFGDGLYNIYAGYANGEIVSLDVVFIEEEEAEEDY